MGLLMSILVVCVGVLEAISCFRHIQNGYLPFWMPHRLRPMIADRRLRRRKPSADDSSSSDEISRIMLHGEGVPNSSLRDTSGYGLTPILTDHRRNTPIPPDDDDDEVDDAVERLLKYANNIDEIFVNSRSSHSNNDVPVTEHFRPISPSDPEEARDNSFVSPSGKFLEIPETPDGDRRDHSEEVFSELETEITHPSCISSDSHIVHTGSTNVDSLYSSSDVIPSQPQTDRNQNILTHELDEEVSSSSIPSPVEPFPNLTDFDIENNNVPYEVYHPVATYQPHDVPAHLDQSEAPAEQLSPESHRPHHDPLHLDQSESLSKQLHTSRPGTPVMKNHQSHHHVPLNLDQSDVFSEQMSTSRPGTPNMKSKADISWPVFRPDTPVIRRSPGRGLSRDDSIDEGDVLDDVVEPVSTLETDSEPIVDLPPIDESFVKESLSEPSSDINSPLTTSTPSKDGESVNADVPQPSTEPAEGGDLEVADPLVVEADLEFRIVEDHFTAARVDQATCAASQEEAAPVSSAAVPCDVGNGTASVNDGGVITEQAQGTILSNEKHVEMSRDADRLVSLSDILFPSTNANKDQISSQPITSKVEIASSMVNIEESSAFVSNQNTSGEINNVTSIELNSVINEGLKDFATSTEISAVISQEPENNIDISASTATFLETDALREPVLDKATPTEAVSDTITSPEKMLDTSVPTDVTTNISESTEIPADTPVPTETLVDLANTSQTETIVNASVVTDITKDAPAPIEAFKYTSGSTDALIDSKTPTMFIDNSSTTSSTNSTTTPASIDNSSTTSSINSTAISASIDNSSTTSSINSTATVASTERTSSPPVVDVPSETLLPVENKANSVIEITATTTTTAEDISAAAINTSTSETADVSSNVPAEEKTAQDGASVNPSFTFSSEYDQEDVADEDLGSEDSLSLGKDITSKESSIKRRKSYKDRKRNTTPKTSTEDATIKEVKEEDTQTFLNGTLTKSVEDSRVCEESKEVNEETVLRVVSDNASSAPLLEKDFTSNDEQNVSSKKDSELDSNLDDNKVAKVEIPDSISSKPVSAEETSATTEQVVEKSDDRTLPESPQLTKDPTVEDTPQPLEDTNDVAHPPSEDTPIHRRESATEALLNKALLPVEVLHHADETNRESAVYATTTQQERQKLKKPARAASFEEAKQPDAASLRRASLTRGKPNRSDKGKSVQSSATVATPVAPCDAPKVDDDSAAAAAAATNVNETTSVKDADDLTPTVVGDEGDDRDDDVEDCSETSAASVQRPSSSQPAFWLIFSGEYTKAMSKDWHSGHFCCWQCDESLTGQRYVLRDDHPYCIKCYESVFANMCEECNKTIGIDSKDLSYKDKHWHEACFLCNKCRVSLVDKQFGSKADKIYCGNCYDSQFASRCDGCGEIFRAGTKKMEYKTRQWHEKCFCCCVCKSAIGTKSFIPREQEIYCATCYEEKFATRCVKCNKIITSGGVTYKNEPWHRECFTCTNCNTSLAGQRFTSRDEKPYCAECFGELFAKRCTACVKPITGIGGTRFISFEDRHWHNDCFICASCKTSLVGRGFITDAEDIICPECAKQKLM